MEQDLWKRKITNGKPKERREFRVSPFLRFFFSTKDRHFCFRQQLFEFSLYQFWLPCTFADYPRRTQVTPHVQRERWYFVAVRQISVNLQSKRIYIFIRKKSLFFFCIAASFRSLFHLSLPSFVRCHRVYSAALYSSLSLNSTAFK